MKRYLLISILIAVSFGVTGCVKQTSPLGVGLLFTNTTHDQTWQEDVNLLQFLTPAGNGSRSGPLGSAQILKKGEDCKSTFFPVNLFYQDMAPSVAMAMVEAGITKIAVVDRSSYNILGFYMKECAIVYGE